MLSHKKLELVSDYNKPLTLAICISTCVNCFKCCSVCISNCRSVCISTVVQSVFQLSFSLYFNYRSFCISTCLSYFECPSVCISTCVNFFKCRWYMSCPFRLICFSHLAVSNVLAFGLIFLLQDKTRNCYWCPLIKAYT